MSVRREPLRLTMPAASLPVAIVERSWVQKGLVEDWLGKVLLVMSKQSPPKPCRRTT